MVEECLLRLWLCRLGTAVKALAGAHPVARFSPVLEIRKPGMPAPTTAYDAPMRRALELALRGPAYGVNPQVGAVLLDSNGNIVAEGWHMGAGTDHAEVAALKNLAAKGLDAAGLTAVVTLEPCNHTGRTGPCAKALVEAGVSKVVYAATDPGDASAKGADTLRAAGIDVVSGVLEAEAEAQARVWLTSARLGRPFVTLKWAASLDGRSAANDGTSKWISGPESREDSHRRRAEVDAILVGTATVLADDPQLTARKADSTLYEHQPLRVILGLTEISHDMRIFDNAAETVQLKTHVIAEALEQLWQRGVRHVWVEGGPKVASEFVRARLVDEVLVYQAPLLLGGERCSLTDIGVATMQQAVPLKFVSAQVLGNDILIRALPNWAAAETSKPALQDLQKGAN